MALTQMDYTGNGGSSVKTGTEEFRSGVAIPIDTGLGASLKKFTLQGVNPNDATMHHFAEWDADDALKFASAYCYGTSGGGQYTNIAVTSDSTRIYIQKVENGVVTVIPPSHPTYYDLNAIWYAE